MTLLLGLLLAPLVISPSALLQRNISTVDLESVITHRVPDLGHIIDADGHRDGYVLLVEHADTGDLVLFSFDLNQQLLWSTALDLSNHTEDPSITVSQSYIIIKNTFSEQYTTSGSFYYSNQISFHVYSISGVNLGVIHHTNLRLTYTTFQISYGRRVYSERIIGDSLVFIDYLTSDRSNIDHIEVNITQYDLVNQARDWTTTVFQSSIHRTNVNLVAGSMDRIGDELQFDLSLRIISPSDSEYLLLSNTVQASTGRLTDQFTRSLSCANCDYDFYRLDDTILISNNIEQDKVQYWEFSTLESTQKRSIATSRDVDVNHYLRRSSSVGIFAVNRMVHQSTVSWSEAGLLAVVLTGQQIQLDEFSLHNGTWASSQVITSFALGKRAALLVDYRAQEILFPDQPTLLDRYLVLITEFSEDQISSFLGQAQNTLVFYTVYALLSGIMAVIIIRRFFMIEKADRSALSYPTFNEHL